MATAKKAPAKKAPAKKAPAAKKPAAKKTAAKKTVAKKAAAKKAVTKKSAAKKPAAKKTSTKKPAAKAKAAPKASAKKATTKAKSSKTSAAKRPAAKKSAAKKPAAKKTAAKKAVAKKSTAKKPAAKKPAKDPAPAPEAAAPAPVISTFVPPTAFSPLFVALESWVNNSKLGALDVEVYRSFNEQYKPSEWASTPALDALLFTFAMDGTGGQFSIWQNGSSDQLEELPVVLLGSEGSMLVLTQSVPEFFALLAAGVDPAALEYDGVSGSEAPHAAFSDFVAAQWPSRAFASAAEIFANAKQKLQASFEAFIKAQL